ncbi:Cytokinin oxidase [Actinokineospora spheciospongiae]|uniref:Cytokinin oxidase n=1 Tax=Actinokineospora spheciospongiae TaxID=909613 RepID=W7IUB2_9PSEU|nr:Cytokinin oxidase [Actinokineospora spheciospongiae]
MALEPITDGPVFARAADDFGHRIHDIPEAVFTPTDEHEVTEAVREAHQLGLPLLARGQGHSTAGQAQVEGGFILDMEKMSQVRDVDGNSMVVEAGATWYTVLDTALSVGMTPPVLTDYLGLSVGGTLSVGGIGGASHKYGAQTDNVTALDAVTPDADLVTCSPQRNSAVFDSIRAGRGRHGVITTAVLPLTPTPDTIRRHVLHYTSLTAFLADQRRAMTLPDADYLEGQAKWTGNGWRYELEFVQYPGKATDAPADLTSLSFDDREYEELDYNAFATRLRDGERRMREIGDWLCPHPWVNYFLPESTTDTIIHRILDTTTLDQIGERGTVLTYPFTRHRMRTPAMQLPTSAVFHLFALLRTAVPAAPVSGTDMIEINHTLDRVVTDNDGTIYLGPLPRS